LQSSQVGPPPRLYFLALVGPFDSYDAFAQMGLAKQGIGCISKDSWSANTGESDGGDFPVFIIKIGASE